MTGCTGWVGCVMLPLIRFLKIRSLMYSLAFCSWIFFGPVTCGLSGQSYPWFPLFEFPKLFPKKLNKSVGEMLLFPVGPLFPPWLLFHPSWFLGGCNGFCQLLSLREQKQLWSEEGYSPQVPWLQKSTLSLLFIGGQNILQRLEMLGLFNNSKKRQIESSVAAQHRLRRLKTCIKTSEGEALSTLFCIQ